MNPSPPPLRAFYCEPTRAEALDWDGVAAVRAGQRDGQGFLWVHLDRTADDHQRWLRAAAGLTELQADALLEDETRPRQVPFGDGLLVIVRGVNLNPGQEPDDMVSLRLFVARDRVISLRSRRLRAVEDVAARIEAGEVPGSPIGLLLAVLEQLIERQVPVVESIEDTADDIEEHLLGDETAELRPQIAELRRTVIGLRRYLAPQRDVLLQLVGERNVAADEHARARMRELADRQARIVEELDSARDRAVIANEELAGRFNERMNRNMYALSIIAGVFLPLGFVTGLLGINVGGIPGTDDDAAFLVVCGLLAITAGGVLLLFRRLRML